MNRSFLPQLLLLSTFFLTASMKEKRIYFPADKNCILIPKGNLESMNSGGSKEIIEIPSFFISRYEVSNLEYLQYLDDLIDQGDSSAWEKALPDTTVWLEGISYNGPYVEYYFRHPAYANYPVVGITYQQAADYCLWLDNVFHNSPALNKFSSFSVSLPDEKQWMYAALGGMANCYFPWGGPDLQNARGACLANFKRIDQSAIMRSSCNGNDLIIAENEYSFMGTPGKLNVNADVTAPVASYYPNGYGIYNMSGNAEEFVLEKGISKGGSWRDPGYYLRIRSKEEYDILQSQSSERGFRFVINFTEK